MYKLNYQKTVLLIVMTFLSIIGSSSLLAQEKESTQRIETQVITEGYKNPNQVPESTLDSAKKPFARHHPDSASRWFELFNINSVLYGDDDHNGFYTGFDLSFDLDVEYGSPFVYAEIWIRSESGYYELLHTTEVFRIDGQNSYDEYVVSTELISAYPSDYYDLLIELYDIDYSTLEPVTSAGSSYYSSLSALPLESRRHGHFGASASIAYSGAGASGWILPVLLLLTVFTRISVLRRSNKQEAM